MNYIPCVAWVKRGVAKSVPDKVELSSDELKELIESAKDQLGDLNIDDDIVTDSDELDSDEDIEDLMAQKKEQMRNRKRKKVKKEAGQDDAGADVKVEEADVDSEEPVGDGVTESKDETETVVIKEAKVKKRKKKAVKTEADDNKIKMEDEEVDDDLIKAYGLDEYDDDEEGTSFDGIGGLTYYATNSEDPYITLKEEGDSDDEDFHIRPEDNLLVCGRVKKDHSNLDVFIYNEPDEDFFIHHDLLLPAFPLAMEWLDFDPGEEKPGNFVAVSSMEPTIGIWDLDLEDAVEPVFVLGSKPQKKKTKKKKSKVEGHTDAVLDLSWNKNVRNVFGSCSADETVILWDLTEGKVVKTIAHDDKVQSMEWHPLEAQTLVTGSFDKTVRLFDCRSACTDCKKWTVAGEVERVLWNWFSPYHLLASSDEGFVYLLDVRTDKSVFTLNAHTAAVTGISLSSQVPNLLVTGSADHTVKVWDIHDHKPQMISEKKFKLGGIQCLRCCPDNPWEFAAGCEKDIKVWDIRESRAVKEHFKDRQMVGATEFKSSASSGDTVKAFDGLSVKDSSSGPTTVAAQASHSQSSGHSKKKKKPKKKQKR